MKMVRQKLLSRLRVSKFIVPFVLSTLIYSSFLHYIVAAAPIPAANAMPAARTAFENPVVEVRPRSGIFFVKKSLINILI